MLAKPEQALMNGKPEPDRGIGLRLFLFSEELQDNVGKRSSL